MALRNWTRVEEYEDTDYYPHLDHVKKVFFNYETGLFVINGQDEEGERGIWIDRQDSFINKSDFDEDTIPTPNNPERLTDGFDSFKEVRKESYEYRANNRAEIPRRTEYDHQGDGLYDIAEAEMVDKEFFATFWEIRFPTKVDRSYAHEWAERLLYGDEQVKAVADQKSMEAYRKAKEQTS